MASARFIRLLGKRPGDRCQFTLSQDFHSATTKVRPPKLFIFVLRNGDNLPPGTLALLRTTIRYIIAFSLLSIVTGASVAARPLLDLAPEEKNWLSQNPVWRVPAAPNPPFSWVDADGRWQGLNEDFLHIIQDRLGIKVEHVPASSWTDYLPTLKKQTSDLCFFPGQILDQKLSTSGEILRLPVAVVALDSNNSIQSFEDLQGKSVAVIENRPTHEKLAREHPDILLKPVKDPLAALSSVARGESDAFVGDIATTLYAMEKVKTGDLQIVTYAPYSIPLRIAFHSDWTVASSILEKTLASITGDERLALREKWITPANDGFTTREIMRVLVPTLFVASILLLVASNWRLKNAVAQRTEELRKAMERVADQNAFLDIEVARRTKEIEVIKDATILALAGVAETRDTDTGAHLRRTQLYVRTLAEAASRQPSYSAELSDEVITILYKTSPLHDIGKVGIPDCILLKPGRLTKEEFEVMKGHVALGGKAIAAAEKQIGTANNFMRYAHQIVMTHHEKWDGSGYPAGLSGDKIPLAGRIMAIADVYDALRTKRVYKDAVSHEEAVQIILEGRGTHFDPGLVDVFIEIHQVFRGICSEYSD